MKPTPVTTPSSTIDAIDSAVSAVAPAVAPGLADARAGRRIDPRLVGCLTAVYLIWSSTFLAMAIAVRELPPMLMASLRYSIAGVIMLGFARRRGAAWPTARQWLRVAPVGALLFIGGNGFVAVAEQTVPSSGVAVVCATMPLWTGVFAAIAGERQARSEWLALLFGFVGVVILMGGPSLAGKPAHIAIAILSPPCWALGSFLARRGAKAAPQDTFMLSATQMMTGGAALAIVGLARAERIPLDASPSAWLALAYLVVFGSLIAFTAYSWLMRNARPVVATSYAYVNPVLAVLIGAAASERFGVSTVIANVLIVGAVALALRKPRK